MKSKTKAKGRNSMHIPSRLPSPALFIREILSLVFAESTIGTCVSAGLVCNQWFECAASEIWKILEDPMPLLELLSPFKEANDGALHFANPILPQSWTRLKRYSSRIRQLTYHEDKSKLHRSVFRNIALSRPELYILPSLSALTLSLETSSALLDSLLFLSPTITNLTLAAVPNPTATAAIQRLSLITRLELAGSYPKGVEDLIELLACLENLEYITIRSAPPTTQQLLNVLSTLPSLQNVALSFDAADSSLNPLPAWKKSRRSCFPKLRQLSFQGIDITSIINFLLAYPFEDLTHLVVDVSHNVNCASQEAQTQLFTTISTVSPAIFHLEVRFEKDDHRTQLNFATINAPLTQLPLRHVTITHPCPIDLTSEDVIKIAKSLGPTIEELLFDAYPYDFPEGGAYLTLNDIVPIAQHCSKLRRLEIFLDAIVQGNIDDISVQFSPLLERVDFGESSITHHSPVVDFLVKIRCPHILVKLKDLEDANFRASWLVVEKVLDKLHEYREAHEAEVKALTQKVENLESKFKMEATIGDKVES